MAILSVLQVNFSDKEHYALVREVEVQLQNFGLQPRHAKIPADAIACALDEVRQFPDLETRKQALIKLEHHFLARLHGPRVEASPLSKNRP